MTDTQNPITLKPNNNIFFGTVMLFVIIHFILNFYGSTYVKQSYLFLTFLVLIAVISYDLKDSIPYIIIHFFIEGQGRIVFGYNAFARVAFDIILLVYITRHIIIYRRIFPLKNVPSLLRFLILAHSLVFFISLFNNKGVGFWLSFPMIKVYIFPIFIFFLFLDEPLDFDSKEFKRLILTISILIICNGIISFKQYQENSPLMLKISPHYGNIGKLGNFVNLTFRPYGTSFVPGGIATYFYLTIGLFFLNPPPGIIFLLVTFFSISTIFMCQVRTAMIQYLILYISFSVIYIRFTKLRMKRVLIFLVTLIVFSLMLQGSYNIAKNNVNHRLLELTVNRSTSIFEKKTFDKSRLGFDDIMSIIIQKINENPFGLGPGRTHTISEAMGLAIDDDPVYNLDYSWNYDNLWASIAIEFGIGGIFYAALILIMPIYLFSMSVTAYRRKKKKHFKTLLMSSLTVGLIVVANWGGVGIPYNPVSFMFWFWCAVGIHAYKLIMEEDQTEFSDEFTKSS